MLYQFMMNIKSKIRTYEDKFTLIVMGLNLQKDGVECQSPTIASIDSQLLSGCIIRQLCL